VDAGFMKTSEILQKQPLFTKRLSFKKYFLIVYCNEHREIDRQFNTPNVQSQDTDAFANLL